MKNATASLENGLFFLNYSDARQHRVKLTGFSLWDTRFETSFVFEHERVLKTHFHLPLQKPTLKEPSIWIKRISEIQIPMYWHNSIGKLAQFHLQYTF